MPAPSLCPPLHTARLVLRRLQPADVDWVWELDQDPVVMQWITGGVPTPRAVLEDRLLPRMLRDDPLHPAFGFWAALHRTTGDPVGWFHLRPEHQEPHDLELGYRLRAEEWGAGLATEGARRLLQAGFEEEGVPRITAQTLAANLRSRRVMDRCGMRLEREFIYPAEFFPGWSEERRRGVRYVMDAASWRERGAA